MPISAKFVLVAFLGAVCGAVCVSLFTCLACAILAPDAFRDGQFFLIFFITVPFGSLLGLFAGIASVLISLQQAHSAGALAAISGASLALLALLAVGASAGTRSGGLKEFFSALLAPWFSVPFLCAVAFAFFGWSLLRRK